MTIPGSISLSPAARAGDRPASMARRSLIGLTSPMAEVLPGDLVAPPMLGPQGACVRPGCDQCLGNSLDGGGVPIYGNWCGPGHGSGEPIDAVDAACKRHDECYARRGYSDCECDRQLLNEMPAAIATAGSVAGQTCGGLIMGAFSLLPCVCRTRVCLPEIGTCELRVPYPCGIKYCTSSYSYPCGVRWCKKWGVSYPCGVKTCHGSFDYPCGTEWCETKVPYPCVTGVNCDLVPFSAGIGGNCAGIPRGVPWAWQPAVGRAAMPVAA